MKRASAVWLAALAGATLLAAEWMRAPGWALTAGILALAVVAAIAAGRDRALLVGASAGILLAVAAGWNFGRIERVERAWPSEREALISRSSRRLGGELDGAVRRARALAEAALPALALPRGDAFTALPRVVHGSPTEGVLLFDREGRPWAWAGAQRAPLEATGPELSAVTTPFYLWLVARRHTNGGTAVAAVLLARDSAAPGGEAVTDRFQAAGGVALRFLAPRLAPADTDVFDYVLPEGAAGAGDTLFAVQPVPPSQATALGDAVAGGRGAVLALIALVLCAAAAGGARRVGRTPAGVVAAVAALGVIARAPLQETFGPTSQLGPTTYFRTELGPFSSSAAALLFSGFVAVLIAGAVWKAALRPRWITRAVAVVGVLLAPYLLQTLARGITPPSSGVPAGLWLTWQGAIVLLASAVVLLAAALVRGTAAPAHAGPWPWIASGAAAGAAALGLWLWRPVSGWPAWYPYLWLPSLFIALKPMTLRGTLATVAVVAGSAAALLTWGSTTDGRMALARRDLETLGNRADAVGVALLDRLVSETPADSVPGSAAELYRLWRGSALGEQGYPAALATWSPGGERLLALDLADIDLPPEQVQQAALDAWRMGLPMVRPVLRVPGLFAVAAIPTAGLAGAGAGVVTVVVGPRSRLVPPSRVAQFLAGGADEPEPPYDVLLTPPLQEDSVLPTGLSWTREGWLVRGERALELPGGVRHAHALIDLRGPWPLLQRGVLILAGDVALLLALWGLLEVLDGRALPDFALALPRGARSLRTRLAISLALFFLVPTLAFAAWSYARLGDEFRGARDLLLQRTLRDAAAALDPASGPGEVAGVSRRVEADLFLSDSGRTTAASAPVLVELGLVDRLVPASAYRALAFGDELLATEPQRGAATPVLIGYRLLEREATGEAAVLAAPELLADPDLSQREADLGIAVMVGVLMGVLAALALAGVAARALARPLEQLREAALALPSGAAGAAEPAAGALPAELEPVGAAIRQAARDVERAQRAQRVLAWGEMARQVAHEIKNPLTPIRLGIQHLLRLRRERAPELGDALEEAGGRILREIDRLDEIARNFSRFAAPDEAGRGPLGAVDVAAVAHDVVELYRVGSGGVAWRLEVADGAVGRCRRDELVQVLVNLCENARDAGAHTVTVRAARLDGQGCRLEVADDGRGIPADVLPRVFEPQFSTTTSGSGLGLAISRRLVESWGGTIQAESNASGTTVTIRLTA